MNRAEATSVVSSVTESLPQPAPYPPCQGVPKDAALALLGNERMTKLLSDPVRKHGPRAGYIYPWNVVDYLDEAAKLG